MMLEVGESRLLGFLRAVGPVRFSASSYALVVLACTGGGWKDTPSRELLSEFRRREPNFTLLERY